MIGQPMGHYGTTKNYGRYLCVREELKRLMNVSEDVHHTWFYTNVYTRILEIEQGLKEVQMDGWRRCREILRECEQEYRDLASKLEDDREYSRAMKRVGLDPQRGEEENEDVPLLGLTWVDIGSEKPNPGVEIYNRALKEALKRKTEFSEEEFVSFKVESLLEHNFIRVDNRYFRPSTEKTENTIPDERGESAISNGEHGVAQEVAGNIEDINHAEGDAEAHVMGNSFGSHATVTINGGNMGAKGVPPRVKLVKRQTTRKSMNAIENQLAEHAMKNNHLSEQSLIAERLQVLEAKLKAAQKDEKAEGAEPRPSMKLRYYTVLKYLSRYFLSEIERNARQPGHLRYNEIILAFLYW